MDSLIIRDEIEKILNQWYVAFLFILVGSAAGLVLAYIVPTPYRATADMYVGIDVTRVNEMDYLIPLAKTEPLNLDDYKNWQLKQVAAILTSDEVLKNSLDEAGITQNLSSFKRDLNLFWYDTGTWRFEVKNRDQKLAEKFVESWREQGYQKIEQLLVVSQETANLDARLFALADQIGSQKANGALINTFLSESSDWLSLLLEQSQNEPLSEQMNTDLNNWMLAFRQNDQLWQVPVGFFPQADDPAVDYIVWLNAAQDDATANLLISQSILEALETEREDVLPDYYQSLEDSLGLSANLVLKPLNSDVQVSQVRSLGNLIVGGTIIGILTWLVMVIFQISTREKENA